MTRNCFDTCDTLRTECISVNTGDNRTNEDPMQEVNEFLRVHAGRIVDIQYLPMMYGIVKVMIAFRA